MSYQNTQIQKGNYIIDFEKDLIAQGKRGQILKCKRKENYQQFCVKVINKTQNYGNYYDEIEALKKLKQTQTQDINVLRIYDVIEENDKFYIFTELCVSTLEKYLQDRWKTISLSLDEINDLLGQIVRGYQYLKRMKISVRDLTPENILVQKLLNNRIILKITGFSINNANGSGITEVRTRNPYYQAPELLDIYSNQIKQYDSCDIYSLGVILYTMCFKGETLFRCGDFQDQNRFHLELRVKKAFQCPKNTYYSQELLQLISSMIVYNPDDRINWDQLDQKLPPKFLVLKELFFVDLQSSLGSGAQGVTHIAYDLRNNEQLVCKIIQNRNLGTSREIQIFEQIKGKYHENVITIVDLIKQTQYTYLIMEKCDQSMQSYLEEKQSIGKQLEPEEIIDILYQIVQGYCFLKQLGIIHRDLKPDNILFKKSQQKNIVKIIDFGVGKIIGKQITFTEAGTPLFSAPEVQEQGGRPYDYQCDIFSLGVILYYLAFLRIYKDIRTRQELKDFHKSLEHKPFVCPNHKEPLISDLINKMIVYDPDKRITWDQLQAHRIFDEMLEINFNGRFIDIYQYIHSLYLLAQKLLILCEEFQKDYPNFFDELLLTQQFIIRFQLSCILCIYQLQKQNVLNFNGIDYRVKSTAIFQKWLNNYNLEELNKQTFQKYAQLKGIQYNNFTQNITKGLDILKEYNTFCSNENQKMNIINCHKFFNNYYQLIRIQILKSNLPIKLKYFMQKFSDVFNEYPIQNFQQYTETRMSLKIFEQNRMESYIEEQLK